MMVYKPREEVMVNQLILNKKVVHDLAIDFLDSYIDLITTFQHPKDFTVVEENSWQQCMQTHQNF